MSNSVYIVRPAEGCGSNDMVIVARNAEEAEAIYFTESNKNGEYYKTEREKGAQVFRVSTKQSHVAYERWDNL